MIDSTYLKAHRTAASSQMGDAPAGDRMDERRAELEASHGLRWDRPTADVLPAAGLVEQCEGRLPDDLEAWLGAQLTRISGKTPLAGAICYALNRLQKLRPYLEDGHLALDNSNAERGMRGFAVGRRDWLFAGSAGDGKDAAIACIFIETAKLSNVDPQA